MALTASSRRQSAGTAASSSHAAEPRRRGRHVAGICVISAPRGEAIAKCSQRGHEGKPRGRVCAPISLWQPQLETLRTLLLFTSRFHASPPSLSTPERSRLPNDDRHCHRRRGELARRCGLRPPARAFPDFVWPIAHDEGPPCTILRPIRRPIGYRTAWTTVSAARCSASVACWSELWLDAAGVAGRSGPRHRSGADADRSLWAS
jgi:hypothetical protein